MGDIFNQLPALGGVGLGGTLVFVILYLLRANYNDRTQHKELVVALRASHKEDADEADKKIDRLEKRIDTLDQEVDRERAARRAAQEAQGIAEGRALALQAVIEGRHYDQPPAPARPQVDPWARPQAIDGGTGPGSHNDDQADRP